LATNIPSTKFPFKATTDPLVKACKLKFSRLDPLKVTEESKSTHPVSSSN